MRIVVSFGLEMGSNRCAMKRRLRKKRHLGEFRQLGFSIGIVFRQGLTVDALHRFAEAFVMEAIEGSSLEFAGGGGIHSGWPRVMKPGSRDRVC